MAIPTYRESQTREKRIAQLKACCETIIDNAEQIIDSFELPMNRQIIIDIEAQSLPTVRVTTEFTSEKILKSLS